MPTFTIKLGYTTSKLLVARIRSTPDEQTLADDQLNEDPTGQYGDVVTVSSTATTFSLEVRELIGAHTNNTTGFNNSSTIVQPERPIIPDAGLDVPISPFFTWQQFVNRFGLSNIIKVSNKDATANTGSNQQPIPTGQPNWYAVQDAFNYATDKVYSILQGGVLKVPLDFTPNGGICPPRIGRAAMIIAFCDMLDMRTPDKVLTAAGWRGKSSPLVGYASELDASLTEIATHKDGIYRQTPEAVHVSDAQPGVVHNWEVQGNVRYVDGAFTFFWGRCG